MDYPQTHTHTRTNRGKILCIQQSIHSIIIMSIIYHLPCMYQKSKFLGQRKKNVLLHSPEKKLSTMYEKKTTLQWIINRRIHIDTHNGIAYGRQTHILDKKEKSR